MKLLLRSKDLDHFYLPWQRLNHIYEDHAKQYDDGATQKDCATRFIFPNRPLMQSYNILRKKDGLALLFLPKKENCFGRKRYPISNRQSILLLQPWPIFGKNIQTIASKVSSPAKAMYKKEIDIMSKVWIITDAVKGIGRAITEKDDTFTGTCLICISHRRMPFKSDDVRRTAVAHRPHFPSLL